MVVIPTQPRLDNARCTLCGLCVRACPCHAIELTERGLVFHCPTACAAGHPCPQGGDCWCACEEACPEGAIECAFEIVVDSSSNPGSLSD